MLKTKRKTAHKAADSESSSVCDRWAVALVFLAAAASSAALWAGEKNGVSPNTVSLPSGAGTIEGLGASFEPQLPTGSASQGFSFALPAGPSLGLTYSTGNGNGVAGFGWKLGTGSVSRQVERGVPRYLDAPNEDTFLGGGQLVELQNGYFLPRLAGALTRYERIESGTPGVFHWQAQTTGGGLLEFGLSESARVALPAADSPDGRERIFRWHLERQSDLYGNVIEYGYSDLGRPGDRRKHLTSIRWGPGAEPRPVYYLATLEYEERPDTFTDNRAGFAIRTSFRLRRVSVALHGAPADRVGDCAAVDIDGDGADETLIRRYDLLYEGNSHWSLLTQVTQTGCDDENTLPPASWRYGTTDNELDSERVFIAAEEHLIFSENAPSRANDLRDIEFIDLNSDGLPDLLHTAGTVHRGYLNRGLHYFAEDNADADCPAGVCRIDWSEAVEPDLAEISPAYEYSLGQQQVHLADMNADGLSDLVVTEGDLVKYFPNRGRLEDYPSDSELERRPWAAPVEMALEGDAPPPPFDFEMMGSVKTLDINFDKRMDVVRSGPGGYLIWRNLGGDRYAEPELTCGALLDGEVLQFRNPRVKTADLNGDRLLDVARIEATRVAFCPSLGYGEFEEARSLEIPDAILSHRQLGHADLKDVNGDGLSDLIVERAEQDALWFWLNLGNDTFSRRRQIVDLHDVARDVNVDWADLNGNGTTDLVYTDSRLCAGLRLRVIDIGLITDGTSHPRLLKTIANGLGARTEISYRTTSDYYQDAVAAGNPWRTSNPKATRVVSRIESSTGLDIDGRPGLDTSRVDITYRDGYYDPARRQFSGFGFVKKIVHGDEMLGLAEEEISGRTLITRNRYHNGAPDGVDNDGDGEIDEVEDWMGPEEEPLKGTLLWSETTGLPDDPLSDGEFADDSVVFNRSLSPLETWEVREICGPAGGALADLLADPGYASVSNERRIIRAVNTRSDSIAIEQDSGPPRLTRSVSNVNALGAPTYSHLLGEIVDGEPADDRGPYTSHEYTHAADAWLLGVPVRVRTTGGGPDGHFISETRNYYDGDPFVGLPLGELGALVQLHRSESFISDPEDPGGNNLPPIEEDSPRIGDPRRPDASVNTSRTRYDEAGRIIESLAPNGARREIEWDPWLHRYPIREIIHSGGAAGELGVTATYNLALGTVTSSRGFNDIETRYVNDVFGRPTALISQDDTSEHPSAVYRYSHANPRPLVGLRPRPGVESISKSTPLLFEYNRTGELTIRPGDVSAVSSVRTSVREETDEEDTIDSIVYSDGAGKTLATLTESDPTGRWLVNGTTLANQRGQTRRTFFPYQQNGEEWQPPAQNSSEYFDSWFDATGRSVRVLQPLDKNGVRNEVLTIHRPFQVDAWDEEDTLVGGRHEGTFRSSYANAFGGIERVVERNLLESDPGDDATEYTTSYEYDDAGKLQAVIDAQGNRKYMRHDGLGRRISTNDLNKGLSIYTYDDLGKMTGHIDGAGQRTLKEYDSLSRILAVNYLDTTGDPATDPVDITYRYDLPEGPVDMGNGTFEMPRNTRGHLVSVSSRAGETRSSWDDRGRVEWTVRSIPDPLTNIPVHYPTHLSYDNLNRMIERTYPDGDRVGCSYDNLERLEQVQGPNGGAMIVSSISYSPEGEIENIIYGNGIETSYSYDSRHRLQEVLTSGSGETQGIELQHISFEFDAASNITKINDLRPDVGATDERHDSKVFEYDDLYRLRSYRLSDPAGIANRGQIDYRYDRIGNLLYRGSPAGIGHIEHTEAGKDVVNLGVYTYGGGRSNRIGRSTGDPPGPHAVTSTESGRNYDYDANGNMTEIDGFAATWDFEDRLVRLEKDDKTIEYVYDHAGRRVVKKITESSRTRYTLYVEDGFEIREGEEPTKYVFAAGRRLARVKGTLDPTAERIQRLRLTEGWNLACLAVELPTENAATVFGLGVDAAIEAVYAFENGKFIAIEDPAVPIERGRPYWIQCSEARILTRVGAYNPIPAKPRPLAEGLNPLGWSRLDALRVDDAFSGLASAWSFDGPSNDWLVRDFPAGPASNLTEPLATGAGIWAFAETDASFDEGATSAQDILFYHPDHLGSTAVVTDLDGRVVSEAAYYPFGVQRYELQSTSWFAGDYKFTGKERDRESGLSYYAARYYEPVLGKFISADPLYAATGNDGGNPQRLGLYTYVLNNPLRFTDPSGLGEEDTHGAMTYRMAIAAGFTEEHAAIIALSAQGMDKDSRYKPVDGVLGTAKNMATGVAPYWHFGLDNFYVGLSYDFLGRQQDVFGNVQGRINIATANLAGGDLNDLSNFGMHFHTLQDIGTADAPGFHIGVNGKLTFYGLGNNAFPGHPMQTNESGTRSSFADLLNPLNWGRAEELMHSADWPSSNPIKIGEHTDSTFEALKRAAEQFYGDDYQGANEALYQQMKREYMGAAHVATLPYGQGVDMFKEAGFSAEGAAAWTVDGLGEPGPSRTYNSYDHWVRQYHDRTNATINRAMVGDSPRAWDPDDSDH
jgi:RHS repeat-associated protein